ncbi:ureidoglycolate lyase [Falsiroseomonas oryziterrae]|uniref:ureidoglycolate lyase n=1 Tax=Falsiroseomonas oryziterrae TaxID=2911368 RepID=UPI001F0242E8|nr:ureidoglycolate lyase [Roseomonas sp. NPKOSM-4]
MRTLSFRAEPATVANIAPFGTLLSPAAEAPVIRSPFYGDTVAIRKPGRFVADDTLEISVATIHPRPLRVSWMERHFLHTQTFFPLGTPFAMVLAPPSEDEMPDLDTARAFLFDGSAGLMLHVGTWHEFPFAVAEVAQVCILIRRDTARDLRHKQGNEARGPDLDKKDIVARAGVTIELAL